MIIFTLMLIGYCDSTSELFGEVGIGINFNKYEDIPVEATGADCPTHINSVRWQLLPYRWFSLVLVAMQYFDLGYNILNNPDYWVIIGVAVPTCSFKK